MEQLMLDLIPTGAKAVCHVSQNDIGRTIRFNLTSGNTAYTLAGTETIKVFIKKPDGTTAERNIANTSSTYVDWVTGEGDCDVAGKNECELVITAGSTVIGSKNFTMKVEEDPYNGQGVVIETAGPAPIATFTTNIIDLFVEIKCEINAIQEGTPWIDSNVIEKEPYNFRKVAGTASRIGNHLFDKLVGGTVAWNQTMKDPTMQTQAVGRSGTLTVSGGIATLTADGEGNCYLAMYADYAPANHVVFMAIDIKYDVANTNNYPDCRLMTSWQGGNTNVPTPTKGQWGKCATIVKPTAGGAAYAAYCFGTDSTIANEKAQFKNPLYVDLTQLFGSTIADYIYSLEQATAGSGVNFFRKLFSKDYYAYNAGELISVKTTAHKIVGKNLLPNLQGARTATSIYIGQTDGTTYPIFLKGGVDYHLSFGATGTNVVAYYKTATGSATNISSLGNFSVSEDMYVQMWLYSESLTSVEWFQLEFGSQKTAYEPYTEHNYALDDVELRGLFKLDSNNKLYSDGDTYESSGDVTRKFNIINLGSINWTKTDYAEFRSNYASNNIPLPKNRNADVKANALCSKVYDVLTAGQTYRGNNRGIATADNYLSIGDSTYETAEALKTALDEVYFIYEVETLTTETADPFTNPQEVDANGTEEYVDNRSVAIPVGHETYYADIYDISGFTTCKVSVKDGSNVEQKSATISFGQTVYDGILEHKNGAWTFTGTHALLEKSIGDMNNGENYPGWKASGVKALIGADLNERFRNQKLNIGTEFSVNTISTSDELYLDKTTYGLTQSQWKATCPDLIVQFRVPLATPFTLTLTGAQLETLLGENRVSHNCNGDTEVKYLYNA